jgi:hypothetical protein
MDRVSPILTPEQLADRWCTSRGYLANLRNQGKGCPYLKLSRKVVYRLMDVEKYESDRRVAAKFVKPRKRY